MRFKSSDITDETRFMNRRAFMAGCAAVALVGPGAAHAAPAMPALAPLTPARNDALSLKEPSTKFESATTYNNFYEFGGGKDDPAREAHRLRARPWTVQVDGLVQKPTTFDIDELLRRSPRLERGSLSPRR